MNRREFTGQGLDEVDVCLQQRCLRAGNFVSLLLNYVEASMKRAQRGFTHPAQDSASIAWNAHVSVSRDKQQLAEAQRVDCRRLCETVAARLSNELIHARRQNANLFG